MKRNPLALAFAFSLSLFSIACVNEEPTDVGDALISGEDVLTFEVILPANDFMVFDTAFSGFVKPVQSNFEVVAKSFENVYDANSLFRFSLPPASIAVRTTGTTIVNDSSPKFVSGTLVLKFDTLTTTALPISLQLFNTAQEWDASATWTNRIDTTNVHLPWTTPGGTRGAQIATATWAAADSAVLAVDSATLALWADSTNKARGAILLTNTNGSRARINSAIVHVTAKSSLRPDTTVTVDLVPAVRTFVYNPVLPTASNINRVGGIAAWRSFIRFKPDLRSLVFPCNGGPPGCRVSLDSVHLNTAELLLPPVATTAGFTPEDSLFIEARGVSINDQVPLERSPLGERRALSKLIAPELFKAPAANDVVKLNITRYVVQLLDESLPQASRPSTALSLLQTPEAQTVGFATFGTPSLRLVLTTSGDRRR